MQNIHADKILILDFGSQYTHLIARRVREMGVYSEIHPWDCDATFIKAFGARAIILSGGPETVTQADTPRAAQIVFELGIPAVSYTHLTLPTKRIV